MIKCILQSVGLFVLSLFFTYFLMISKDKDFMTIFSCLFLWFLAIAITKVNYDEYFRHLINARLESKDKYKQEKARLDKQRADEKREKKEIELAMRIGNKIRKKELEEKYNTYKSQGKLCCPKCGSEQVASGTRGFTLTTGFIASGNVRIVCLNCGHKWKPNQSHL